MPETKAHKTRLTGERYIESVGRRKTSIARVRLSKGSGDITVEGKPVNQYFQLSRLADLVASPLTKLQLTEFNVSAKVSGGGVNSQAEAVRLGIARALVTKDEALKAKLRAFGFLTRDPRAVERKKPGLKKARRAPQWSKR